MLEYDPDDRISAYEVLNHKWFKTMKTREKLTKIQPEVVKNYVKNVKHYKNLNKLQHAVLAFIVHNIEANEDVKAAQRIFLLLDENLEGRITRDELRKGLKKFFPEEESAVNADEIFNALDQNNSGSLEYEEFMRACLDKNTLLNENILRYAFEYFDNDSSGRISLKNLLITFNVENDKNDKEFLKNIIKQYNLSGTGEISFEEFQNMMRESK